MDGNFEVAGSMQTDTGVKRYISEPEYIEENGLLIPKREVIELHQYPERLPDILKTEVFKTKKGDNSLTVNRLATTNYRKKLRANLPLLMLHTGTPVELFLLQGREYVDRDSANRYFWDVSRATTNRISMYKGKIEEFLEKEKVSFDDNDYLVYNTVAGKGRGVIVKSAKPNASPIYAMKIVDFLK